MFRGWGVPSIALIALSQSACVAAMHERVERTTITGRRVLDERVDTVEDGPVALRVRDTLIMDTRLKGRVERSAMCRRVTVRKFEPTIRKETVFVDGDGETANLGRAAWVEVLLGVAMPLIGPLAYVAADEEEEEEGTPNAFTESEVRGVFIGSIVIGGLLLLDGVMTGIASATAGVESEGVGPPQTEIEEGPRAPCEKTEDLQADVLNYISVGTASATVAVQKNGRFDFDLRRLADAIRKDPALKWSFVRSDGSTCPIEVPVTDRYRLAGRLEEPPSAGPAEQAPQQ